MRREQEVDMDLRAKRRLPEDAVGSRTSVASATSESVALTTMTSAAILGVLAGTTEAAREAAHRAQIQTTTDLDAPQEAPPPQTSEAPPPHAAAPLALEPVEAPSADASATAPAEHSELAPLNGTPQAAQAVALDAAGGHDTEIAAPASQSVIGSAAASSTTTASSGLLTIDTDQTLGSALSVVEDFGQQLTQTLDGLAANVTALTTTIETSLNNLSSLLDLTTATNTITTSIEQLSQTLTSTTSSLAAITEATTESLAGLTSTITDTVTGTVGSLLDTLPSTLLGGPEAPQVDDVFQTAFAKEDATQTTLAADSHESDAAASFLHMGDDLLPFAVELPAVQLGFLGQSYAEVVDPHDTTFSTLGHGLHG
jgi:hypothetical protein